MVRAARASALEARRLLAVVGFVVIWPTNPTTAPGCARGRVPALAHEGRGGLIVLRRDRPQLRHRLAQRYELDPGAAKRRHGSPPALVRRVDGRHADPGREDAVKRRGRAAALDVAEHRGSRLESGALLDLALEALTHAPEPGVTELVL